MEIIAYIAYRDDKKGVSLSLLVSGFPPSDDIFLKDLCRREQILPPSPDETARHPERLRKASLDFLYFL